VIAAVLGVLVVSVEGVRRLSFDADVLSLLPRDNTVIQAFRTFLARFGSLDQLYVVFTAPEGHAVSEYDDQVQAWVDRLRMAPEISRVDAGVVDRTRDFAWLADRQLLVLDGERLDAALDRLTPAGLPAAVAARRDLLTVPSAEVAALVRQDPVGLFDLVRDALGGSKSGVNIGVGSEGYLTPDGRRRLIIARPRQPPYDAEFSRALDARLNAIRASVDAEREKPVDKDDEPLPPMQVQFAGGHRIAVETEAVVKSETWWNTFGSLVTILPLLWFVFRSLWLVGVGSLPSGLALVVVLGAIGFTGEKLSAATTGAAAMLFGLGIDGVVLLYVAYRLAAAENPAGDAAEAIGGPSSSMLLGMWTTAATFYGLMFVDFPSLQHLGRLLGHSMVVCGILTLVMVPAFLPRRPQRRGRKAALVLPRLAAWIARWRRGVLAAGLAATVALGAAATRVHINPTLDRLRSVTPAAQLESTIGPAFGLPSDVYVVLAEGGNLEALLETNERLARRLAAELPGLTFQPPTRLLPSAKAQNERVSKISARHLSADAVRVALEQARVAGDFTPGAFDPFAARLPSLLDRSERLTYDGYTAHGLGDLIERFIARNDAAWTLATYVFPDANEAGRVQRIVDEVDPAQRFTGLTLVNRELARSFLPQFVKGLAIGTVIVIILVIAAFRDWRLSLYALLPTAIGLIWAAGVLALAGVELDLFAVFAVVTFVGIGVDYGIHLVHRYQERGHAERATAELAPVILVAAAITMLGYGTLVTSSYPPLRSIGVVSAISVVTLAVASVFVLPALLMTERRIDSVDRVT
jgi:predicted exporter